MQFNNLSLNSRSKIVAQVNSHITNKVMEYNGESIHTQLAKFIRNNIISYRVNKQNIEVSINGIKELDIKLT